MIDKLKCASLASPPHNDLVITSKNGNPALEVCRHGATVHSPSLILLNKNHYLISASKQLSLPTMSARIEAVITRPRPPWLPPPRPRGAIMGKGKTGAYLWQERKRGTLPRAFVSHPHCVRSPPLHLPPSIYLKPNQTGWSGGVERRGGRWGGGWGRWGVWINSMRTKRKRGEKTFEAR